ncbi:MAG TPA: glycerol-3-phosphate 1-O-acyltransferase PlsY [Thermoanaerobaculia bacterium]|nr:glycerol-3-phosphate 1-O-acyltransferase PlsY [Thermoanaerobaculia bacterium]
MSEALRGPLVLLVAYVLGALPWSVWIARWTRGIDVRQVGSGNPGATNVLRSAGRGPGLAALACDVFKGVAAVVLARAVAPSASWLGWAALAAVAGHVFSIFLGFRGGKGVATAAGALAAISPQAFLAALVVFAVSVAATRYVSLGSMLGAVTFPVALWLVARPDLEPAARLSLLVSSSLIALLVLVRHRANLERLLAGTENRLGRARTE